MTEIRTRTLDVPGAVLTCDVRANDASTEPVLFLIGSPMGAAGFGTLAGFFRDRTVVTYDPRGVERSRRTDGAAESTPEEHADDLHRLIAAIGAGPVDLFASSGGAINALALVAAHPGDVRTVIAHEPPLAQLLPDREEALVACVDIHETYLRGGVGPAMAKFIMLVSHSGPVPADFPDWPVDPAMFGLPTEDDGSRDDPLVGQNMISSTHYRPDVDALLASSTRIVVGVGATSGETLAARAARAVAERLGTEATVFPGGHDGFLGGEYGQTGEPEPFARTLAQVLAGRAAQAPANATRTAS
jgi:pimeloyl-ACP methyl ester carboxylesterase